jgi:hypothetical protein
VSPVLVNFNCQRRKKHPRGPKQDPPGRLSVISEYINFKTVVVGWEKEVS